MADPRNKLPARSGEADIQAFIERVKSTPRRGPSGPRGRLIFAMDATASREPTWDRASHIQAQMFTETDALGGLDVQLCYYRGFMEFHASHWVHGADALLGQMTAVRCAGGMTQIERVLDHALSETATQRVNAVVFVGDCMEENVDQLCHRAGELGLKGVPVFTFHEGNEPVAERAFREVARLSGGAYCRFDAASARQLRDLLSAVAVFAAGGRKALSDFGQRHGGIVALLSHQVRR